MSEKEIAIIVSGIILLAWAVYAGMLLYKHHKRKKQGDKKDGDK